ncbi:uncharacterized protein [Epargyreus clarus]|uniref:uncharacterized protein n=1 Tax=Epargyreus clarus TaxID=520877 RepID=UPI003C2D7918
MDVYGYPSYQYSQSDELAKQMIAQQALAPPYNNRPGQEPHFMPAPSGAPWNYQRLPWGVPTQPSLVEFTAQQSLDMKPTPVIHCKRKSLDVEPVIPAKQLITEEKMAAHLNSLHISSDFTKHSLACDESMEMSLDPIREKLKGHTIVLSDEVRKIQEEPLLPAALIERLEKPHMSLVVWKPRENLLEKIKESDEKDGAESPDEECKKRNGVLVPDLTGMDVEM